MQKLVELKRRMATVRNIQDITRALATVSSAKLSRTRLRAAGMRRYVDRMRTTLGRQQAIVEARGVDFASLSPFLTARSDPRRILLLHLAADRGMCGNYNVVANREALRFIEQHQAEGRDVGVACKGMRGERYLRRRSSADIVHAEEWKRAGVTSEEVDALFDRLAVPFLEGEADEVYASYTQFFTPLQRVPRVIRLLPVAAEFAGTESSVDTTEGWCYQPDLMATVGELISLFVRMQIEDVLLASYASEQGARMITMEEATERADKMLQQCVVKYNRLRREVITIDLLGVLFASRLRAEEQQEHVGSAMA